MDEMDSEEPITEAEAPKKTEALDLLKVSREERVKYAQKLFEYFRKLSNLRESIRVGEKTLGEAIRAIDEEMDNGAYEYSASQYRVALDKVLEMVGIIWNERLKILVDTVIQLLNEYHAVAEASTTNLEQAQQQCVDLSKQVETLKLKVAELEKKVPVEAQVSGEEAGSDGEKGEEKERELTIDELADTI